ncbi:multicomponent K+:H+ antiporter subunit A [Marinospirillum alkaliphilum DSM 21637]|uniref:Multicomponent K+:H+ antiporter subunit A n=2 Tax=Marinospirillum TaxID=64968 RepID=A0A1K1ZNN9_9GAMM|nr:monovalent cation/H+ antiporter subunit A [Marinospirillum alkaliphilum]SFX75292.1 multicomponent K+:H+ antiporter subunit A [Marinospirillum alkaliphilum DSM 21637]
MALALLFLFPLLGALLPVFFASRPVGLLAVIALLPALASFLLVVLQLPLVLAGETLIHHWQWVPSLGLTFSLRLDALGGIFALLISGIGSLIILFARHYFAGKENAGRFYVLMLLFMAAMLGLVTSENLLVLLVFWEMTSLISFLLVAFSWQKSAARRGARMTLVITAGGGLALLAGLVLLGQVAGSLELSQVLASGEAIKASAYYEWILVLILLGAFAKSAQFPFHLWLPHAMAAPTPVSAYLHSATLVKAGIFLLMRLHPALAETHAWFTLVTLVGMSTLMLGAFVAMFMHDMKGLLAYSTLSHLGLITLLLGLGSPLALGIALFHLIGHALFKAPLFMMAGYVDLATGTRDLRKINGLWRYYPGLMVLTAISAAAMAGLPLLSGYFSKKMLFAASLTVDQPFWAVSVLPLWVTLAGGLSVAYSARIFHNVFFNGQPQDLPKGIPQPLRRWALLPLLPLVVLTLVIGWHPVGLFDFWVVPVTLAATGQLLPSYDFAALDSGWPFWMSLLALIGGIAFYAARNPLFALHARLPEVDAKEIFETLMRQVILFTRWLVHQLENGSLQRYLALLFTTLLVLLFWALQGMVVGPLPLSPVDPAFAIGALVLAVAAIGVVMIQRKRLLALLLLGVVGLIITLFFARFSAPDLALTQLSVEVMAVVIMMLALSFLPQRSPHESSKARRGRDLFLAGGVGAAFATLAYGLLTRPLDSISGFFLEQSVPGGGGTNVVNVILVDFRGFDTLGEITVLAIAAVAVFAFTQDLQLKSRVSEGWDAQGFAEAHPLLLRVTAGLVLPIALMVSAYIFLRGHNMPGGGFIAGLVTAVALTLQYMAGGLVWAQQRMRTQFRPLIGAGILLATLTGLGSLVFGYPFLTSTFGHFDLLLLGEVELASVLVFDLGVYAVVVGSTLLILANLGRLMTVAGPGKEVG